MEAINYANGSNMTLPADAQIVQGVSGNAVYLPAGAGTMPIAGNRNELTISLWRQWDGVVEADDYRGIFKTANIKAYFDQETDFLTIELAGTKTVTDIKDDQEQAHWCFLFSKNSFFKIYKNAELKAEASVGNYPVDFSEGFTLGGGRTHATFDEVRMYKTVVTEPEIRGLYRLVTKGTQVQQLENIVTEAAPKYLGVVETVPDTKTAIITKGEKFGFVDANPGDWVLSGRTIGGWKVGVCYKWSGLAWKPLEPAINYAKEYQSCLVHLFEIEELKQQTGHFGALFAKVLVTQKALIDELLVNQAFIKNLAGNEAFLNKLTVKRLLIDNAPQNPNDFEMKINENDGIRVKNGNQILFEVSPQGKTFFSGELDCQGFKVVNTGANDSSTVLFSWNAGDNAFRCTQKILNKDDPLFDSNYSKDFPKIDTFFGKGTYGHSEIECVRLKRYRHYHPEIGRYDVFKIELLYFNNNIPNIASIIRCGKRVVGDVLEDTGMYSWEEPNNPSVYNFTFKSFTPKQKIYFSAINYGKPDEANIIYKDENGFLKIS